MFEQYWNQHPTQYALVQIVREGQWVTHVFEWLFMMISRFAGYAMTLAIGYLIYYAIEFKHSLDAVIVHPGFADELASLSNVIINVGPELVFPGVVVLCIRAFQRRSWVDAVLYLVTTIWFVILTMVLLNAYMSNQITANFLSAMLFWRAGAALFYTVVAAYAGGHGGLDFKSLLHELDTLRTQLDGGQQTVSSLRVQLSSVQGQVSSLQHQLDTERQRARIELDSLRGQLDSKQQEIEGLRQALSQEQVWQAPRLSSLQQQVSAEQETVATLRRDVQAARARAEELQGQLDSKQRELERVQAALSSVQRWASTQQSVQVSSKQEQPVDSGQRGKIVRLDTSRGRQRSSEESAIGERIRAMLREEPSLSARAIAARLGCSPTTAAKWKSLIEHEDQAANE